MNDPPIAGEHASLRYRDAFASPHDLMRVLGAIVHSQPLLMPAGQAKSLKRGAVGAQLVGDRQLGRKPLFAEQLAHQPHGGPLVPARLDQQVENFALLVDGPPQIHALAADPHDHLVQVPAVTRPWSPLPQPASEQRPEFQHPAPDRLVRQVEPAFGKDLLGIPVAEGKPQIEPDRVLDDRRREAVAAVRERGHAGSIAQRTARLLRDNANAIVT
jgi:hypothetical protein